MTRIPIIDEPSMRRLSELLHQAERLIQRYRTAYQRQRLVASGGGGGGKKAKRGRPEADIPPGQDGTIAVYDASGVTSELADCHNPYGIILQSSYFVRLVRVKGWEKPFAVPDDYVACQDPQPVYVPVDA